ncbi:MAG: MFS transporter [Caulobacter sp.]
MARTVKDAEAGGGGGLVVFYCFLVAVLEGFDIQAMGVAAPKFAAELGLAKDVLGEALAASNIGLVLGAVLGGWLADRLGRKRVLIGSVLMFGAFTLLTMRAGGFTDLFAARLGAGLGFGAALPNIMALSAEVGSADRRGSTGAMMFCGMPLGGGLVAMFSYLAHALDWRVLFLVGGLAPLVLAGVMLVSMKTPAAAVVAAPREAGFRWKWLALVPLYGLFYAVLAGLRVLPGMAAIGGLAPWLALLPTVIVGYLAVNRHALFGEGRAAASWLLWLIFFPTLLILYLVLNWLPTLVIDKGFVREASLASAAFNFASVVGALVLGRLVDGRGLRWPLASAYVGLIVGLLALARAADLAAVLALSGVVGFCLLGANYALYGAAASYYPAAFRGRGAGAAVAWGRFGAVIGPLVGGQLLQAGRGGDVVVIGMAPIAGVALLGVILLTALRR